MNEQEPKFGEWQKGPIPKGIPVLTYHRNRNSAEHGDIAVLRYNDDVVGYWMPLPTPPKDKWREAWDKHGDFAYSSMTSFQVGYEAGFEAGRDTCNFLYDK